MSAAVLSRLWDVMPDISHYGVALQTVLSRILDFRRNMTIDEQMIVNHIIAEPETWQETSYHHQCRGYRTFHISWQDVSRLQPEWRPEQPSLGHMQRGGSPTCKDRVYASTMGAYAVDLLCEGKSNRVVAYKDGKFVDFDVDEALAMEKHISDYQFNVGKNLSI